VNESPVDFLVNISNDGWFGVADPGSGPVSLWRRAQHEAHLAISVFRAVECRRSMVRAVNTGISAIIDSDGRIIQASGKTGAESGMTSEVLVGKVPLDHRTSVYVRTGDWLAIVCLVTTVALLIARAVMSFRRVSHSSA
jgi:apolipoprotein N-acyltransferase